MKKIAYAICSFLALSTASFAEENLVAIGDTATYYCKPLNEAPSWNRLTIQSINVEKDEIVVQKEISWDSLSGPTTFSHGFTTAFLQPLFAGYDYQFGTFVDYEHHKISERPVSYSLYTRLMRAVSDVEKNCQQDLNYGDPIRIVEDSIDGKTVKQCLIDRGDSNFKRTHEVAFANIPFAVTRATMHEELYFNYSTTILDQECKVVSFGKK